MWIVLAFGSAAFAALTSILAKCGIRKTDSTVATAIRTAVVLLMSCIMVLVTSPGADISGLDAKTWIFLILSGIMTGASWLCYFKALSLGDVNKVVPIDKSSTVLTMLLSFVFFGEFTPIKLACCVAIGAGTYLMIEKKAVNGDKKTSRGWFVFAALSAIFAVLTSIFAKIGITGVDGNVGTMIRTAVVLVMAWITVFATKKGSLVRQVPFGELGFIILSGLATGGSWLCYFNALALGPASVVVPIDKLSIVLTVAFSFLFFGEKLTKKAFLGLILIVAGTLCLLI